MANSVIEEICGDLNVPTELVTDALHHAHIRYKKLRVKKRSGGYRTMIQPASELKLVQSWLLARVLSKLPISRVATAFQPGASIVRNAEAHGSSLYSVRVDLTEFFPSIRYKDLQRVVSGSLKTLPAWVKSSDFDTILRTACFDRVGELPIGYMTSPCIANAVMYSLDCKLAESVEKDEGRFGQAVITRYADDFVFSSNRRGACREFLKAFRDLLARTRSPRLRINDSKTRFMSRAGGSTIVTGLRINAGGAVRVHPNYRDHVRLMLKLYATNRLQAEDIPRLRGHLAFVRHADPGLFTRLSFRFYKEIDQLGT